MHQIPQGRPFRAEAEITTATTTTLTLRDGDKNTMVVAAKERIEVIDVYIQTAVAQVIRVFSDDDDDGVVDTGELIIGGTFAAQGGVSISLGSPHYCPKSINKLKVVTASAGLVIVKVMGKIVRTN